MEKVSAQAENAILFFETGLGFSARAENVHPWLEGWKTSCNPARVVSLRRRIDGIFNETKWRQWKNCA